MTVPTISVFASEEIQTDARLAVELAKYLLEDAEEVHPAALEAVLVSEAEQLVVELSKVNLPEVSPRLSDRLERRDSVPPEQAKAD